MSGGRIPTLYRIVRGDQAIERDFLSRMMPGFPPRDPERQHPELWAGISMFDALAVARGRARALPQLGAYIAAVRIESIDPRKIVLSVPGSSGHLTVWGPPGVFLPAVVAIMAA